jgi:hypothetical protein
MRTEQEVHWICDNPYRPKGDDLRAVMEAEARFRYEQKYKLQMYRQVIEAIPLNCQ